MSRDKSVFFFYLDRFYEDFIKSTSDKSKVFIIEKGMVAIQKTKNIINTDVFIVPKLKTKSTSRKKGMEFI
jgi:hypothetical protein